VSEERPPRCRFCGAAQPASRAGAKRCHECRSPLSLAADPVARGPVGWCTRHPDEPTTGVCSSCGAFTCTTCEVSVRGIRYCLPCREQQATLLGAPVPWEQRRSIGFFRAWWRTTASLTATPARFYEGMEPSTGLAAAFGYGLIGSTFQWLWGILFGLMYAAMFLLIGLFVAVAPNAGGAPGLVMLGLALGSILFTFTVPLWNLLAVLMLASIQHLCLRIAGAGGEHGLYATLKIACYALSPGWTGIIPYMGQMGLPIWWCILMVVGVSKVHECSPTRALVILVPFLIAFLSPVILYMAFMFLSVIAGMLG
jgi:hypothetical protein